MAEKTVSEKLKGLSKAQLREVAKEVGATTGSRDTAASIRSRIERSLTDARRHGTRIATVSEIDGPTVPRDVVAKSAASFEAKQADKIASAVEKVRAAAPAKAPKAKPGRVAGMTADSPFPSAMTKGSRTGTAADSAARDRTLKPSPSAALARKIDTVGAIAKGLDRLSKDLAKPTPSSNAPIMSRLDKLSTDLAADRRQIDGAITSRPAPPRPSDPKATSHLNYLRRQSENHLAEQRVEARSRNLSRLNTGVAAVGTGVAAGRAFQEAREGGASIADAAMSAGVTAAPGVAMMAGKPVGNALSKVGSTMMSAGGGLISEGMGMTGLFTDFIVAKMGMGVAAAGAVTKVAGETLKVASKVAGPVMVGYGAYQGAKEDTASPTRGAIRGALRSLDPSAIVMKRGVVEQGFDAIAGRAGETRTASKGPSMAMSVASAAPASTGSSRGPAAPESSKTRTDPYTDSLGRNYANGRLIVRDK